MGPWTIIGWLIIAFFGFAALIVCLKIALIIFILFSG